MIDLTTRRRVLVAGGLDEVTRTAATVDVHRDWGLEVVGLVSDGSWRDAPASHHPVVGTFEDISALTQNTVVDEVMIAPAGRRFDQLKDLESVFLQLEEQGIIVRLLVNFLPQSFSDISFDVFGGIPILTLSTAPRDELLLLVRRVADLAGATLLLTILGPVSA